MAGALALPLPTFAQERIARGKIRLGVIADLHGGLAEDASDRLDAFLKDMASSPCDALVQLGDFAFPNNEHQSYANRLNAAHREVVHVVGNHEFDYGLTRADCYRAWGISSSYYRRDVGDLRILVLDGNDKGSPTHRGGYPSYVGQRQLSWLEHELRAAEKPILILSHQPLAGHSSIDNAQEVQNLLSDFSSNIVLCLNGHSHTDSLIQIEGISYLHFNSASYFWVGGETRMAYYTEPIYSIVSIDPESGTINVSPKTTQWRDKSPEELGYFDREGRPPKQVVTPQIRPHHVSKTELKVMTWNIWGRLNQDPRYTINDKTARERVIDIIEASRADIIAMVETYGSAADIAAALGFHYHTAGPEENLCIFSRYPLSDLYLLSDLNPFSFIAATITLPGNQPIRLYDIWLTSGGRHIVDIKNPTVSDDEFSEGDDIRHDHLLNLLEHDDFKKYYSSADSIPIIVAGDFNCVSHLDHSIWTKAEGLNHARALTIEASRAMADLGFVDTFRAANPDVTRNTYGYTWTTVGPEFVYESDKGFMPTDDHPRPEYRDPYARIDYIYSLGKKLEVFDSKTISHHASRQDRSFPEFPSDHAAVMTTFRVAD